MRTYPFVRRNYSSNGLQNPPETEIIPVLDKPTIPILHYLFIYFCKEGTTENYLTIGNKTNNLIDFFIKKNTREFKHSYKNSNFRKQTFFFYFFYFINGKTKTLLHTSKGNYVMKKSLV